MHGVTIIKKRKFRSRTAVQYPNSLTGILIQSCLFQEVQMLQLKINMNFHLLYSCYMIVIPIPESKPAFTAPDIFLPLSEEAANGAHSDKDQYSLTVCHYISLRPSLASLSSLCLLLPFKFCLVQQFAFVLQFCNFGAISLCVICSFLLNRLLFRNFHFISEGFFCISVVCPLHFLVPYEVAPLMVFPVL